MQQLASLVMRTAERPLLRRQGGSFSVTSEFLKYQRMWANALQGLNLATRWGRASGRAAVIYLQVVRRKNLLSATSLPGKCCLNETKVSVCCFITFCFTKKKSKPRRGRAGIALKQISSEFLPPPDAARLAIYSIPGPLAVASPLER